MKNIPFSPPDMTEAEIIEVCEALRSGWITTGPRTKEFEHLIAMCCQTSKAVCLNSATACMELILRVLGVGPGDEVIVPSYTYTATASVVCHVGAKVVMVDTLSGSFEMDYDKLSEVITERTKVVIPVDLGGVVCDYDRIFSSVESKKSLYSPANDIQKAFGRVVVLADAAHAFGAKRHGKMCGEIADFTSFSFHAVKNLTTAEGGAIMLNLPEPFDNEEVYRYLCTYTLHGQNKDALAKTKKGAWRYDVLVSGFKGNMTDIMASIGLVELSRYEDDTLHYRKCIYDQYTDAFSRYGWAELPIYETEDRKSSYHVYCLRVKGITEQQRDEIIQRIFDKDVSVNVHFQPLPLLSAFKNKGYKIEDYPVAYDNYCREISLPVWYGLSEEMVKTVIDAVICSVEEVLA